MVSDSLYRYLSTDAGVVALVSTRIFPMVIPQQSYDEATKQPCLVYTIDTDTRGRTFSSSETVVQGSLQVDCYARSYAGAQALAAATREALIDLKGTLSGNTSPASSVAVQQTYLEGESCFMDEEPGLYRVMQRYTIWYDES